MEKANNQFFFFSFHSIERMKKHSERAEEKNKNLVEVEIRETMFL